LRLSPDELYVLIEAKAIGETVEIHETHENNEITPSNLIKLALPAKN